MQVNDPYAVVLDCILSNARIYQNADNRVNCVYLINNICILGGSKQRNRLPNRSVSLSDSRKTSKQSIISSNVGIKPYCFAAIMKNREHFETHLFLENQLRLGFEPKWFITYHYKHPSENMIPIRETSNPFGFQDRIGFKGQGGMWNQVSWYEQMERKRNSYDSLIRDTSQIKNCILKYLYGINRLNQEWKLSLIHI